MRRLIPCGVFALLVASDLGDHYFRDEFYYLACSHHLAWGYVDQPPLSIALLWLVRHVAGDSLLTLRVTAAAASALAVWVTGSIARRIGAGAFGEAIAMLVAAVAPEFLAIGSFYSMNVFDVLFWTMSIRVFIEVVDASESPLLYWVLLGVSLGAGLENKISVLWLGAGIGSALLLTRARRLLLTPGPWIAGAIAAALFAPHVIWQMAHGWPTLEFIHNASVGKMRANTPLGFVGGQIMTLNPALCPIWIAGLLYLVFGARGRYRALAIIFLTVAAILIANRTSRSEYLAPAYPMLFAAGGVVVEHAVKTRARRIRIAALVLLVGAISAPMAIPLLPIDTYVRYSRALGQAPSTEEKQELGRLPQFFADRQGWNQIVDQIAVVWQTLTPTEQARAAIFVGNYGDAGAIELLGASRGLTAISGHNNYWLWGPQGRTGDVMIVLSRSRDELDQIFSSVRQAGEINCGDCMPFENHQLIFVCRDMKPPSLSERWPELKHYD